MQSPGLHQQKLHRTKVQSQQAFQMQAHWTHRTPQERQALQELDQTKEHWTHRMRTVQHQVQQPLLQPGLLCPCHQEM